MTQQQRHWTSRQPESPTTDVQEAECQGTYKYGIKGGKQFKMSTIRGFFVLSISTEEAKAADP
jgi:hypothetical protein